jgi:hypothetical protein
LDSIKPNLLAGPRFSGGGFNMSVRNHGGDEIHLDNVNYEVHYEGTDNGKSISTVSDHHPVKYTPKKKTATSQSIKSGGNKSEMEKGGENENTELLIESAHMPGTINEEIVTINASPKEGDIGGNSKVTGDIGDYKKVVDIIEIPNESIKGDVPSEAIQVDETPMDLQTPKSPSAMEGVEIPQVPEVVDELPPLPDNKAQEILRTQSQPTEIEPESDVLESTE